MLLGQHAQHVMCPGTLWHFGGISVSVPSREPSQEDEARRTTLTAQDYAHITTEPHLTERTNFNDSSV
jgi:hypothetical protein